MGLKTLHLPRYRVQMIDPKPLDLPSRNTSLPLLQMIGPGNLPPLTTHTEIGNSCRTSSLCHRGQAERGDARVLLELNPEPISYD